MLSRTEISIRLSRLSQYHFISYLFQANKGYHVVILRAKLTNEVLAISSEQNTTCAVDIVDGKLIARKYSELGNYFQLLEHVTI